ncbi:helix-turn-helix transcriptional regulator [Leucobacter chinensis]|uniref:helix-turn-helix transcriptional regulator n=1 Tax=Leucobacter chinensis TaxID=2851010 RepID=UPI001C24F337|nr:AraC family transcriptional regulator [Leucobacter chinensis]
MRPPLAPNADHPSPPQPAAIPRPAAELGRASAPSPAGQRIAAPRIAAPGLAPASEPSGEQPIDRLDAMLRRFSVRAQQFHVGPMWGTRRFDPRPGQGFLHVLRAGQLTLVDGSGREARTITEPTLLFYPRAHEHTFVSREPGGVDLACATLEFDGASTHPLVATMPPLVTVPTAEVQGLELSLELLSQEAGEVKCGHRHVVDRVFEIVLLKLLRHLLDQPELAEAPVGLIRGFSDPQIARALTAVHEQPGAEWSLDSLAETAHMSRSAFSARFRELVAVPPHDYLIDWRMTVGKQLLMRDYSVAQVAAEVGYTGSSFSRVFAQREGQSPRAWLDSRRALLP